MIIRILTSINPALWVLAVVLAVILMRLEYIEASALKKMKSTLYSECIAENYYTKYKCYSLMYGDG